MLKCELTHTLTGRKEILVYDGTVNDGTLKRRGSDTSNTHPKRGRNDRTELS